MNVHFSHFSRTSAHHGLLLDQGGHGAAAAPDQTIVLGVRDGLRVEIHGGVSLLGGVVLPVLVVLLLLLVLVVLVVLVVVLVVLVVLVALLLLLLSFLLLLMLATAAAAALLLLVRPHLFPFPPFPLHVRPQIVLR